MYFSVGLILILGASCSSHKNECDAPEYYDLSEYESIHVNDILEVAEVVPLLFERDTYPKRPTFINFLGSNIVIEESEERIHVFSEKGHYIGCSDSRRGQGPGEFTMLIGHVVNPFAHTIDAMNMVKMMSYDAEFSHCDRESTLPTVVGTADKCLYDDGIALSESKYLLHSSIVTDPYKIIVYDATLGETVNMWNYADEVIAYFHSGQKKFFRMPDGEVLMAGEGYTPFIYGVDSNGDSLYKAIEFKYNDKTITDHVTVDDFRKNHDIAKQYYESYEVPKFQMVNSKFILTGIQNGTDFRKDYYMIISDRSSGKNYRINYVDDGELKIPFIQTMDENYIYSALRKMDVLDNHGYLLNKADQAEDLLSEIDDEDFVLLKYRIKKTA